MWFTTCKINTTSTAILVLSLLAFQTSGCLRRQGEDSWLYNLQRRLMRWGRKHKVSMAVHERHLELGDFVRLSPDHLSVAHPDGIRVREIE